MLHKCGSRLCRRFFWVSQVSFARCKVCSFVATRCEKCGGIESAKRSVKCHVSWYRGLGVKKYGMVDYHNPDIQVTVDKAGKLRLVG